MLSLLETIEKLRRGETVGEMDLKARQNTGGVVEQFLAHTALSFQSLHSARSHLADALRAIDYADNTLLQMYVDLSKLLQDTSEVSAAAIRFGLTMVKRRQFAAAFDAIAQAVKFSPQAAPGCNQDPALWEEVCAAYEEASRTLGRNVHPSGSRDGPVRVGFLTSELVDGSQTQRLISAWIRHANVDLASLRVYCTDIAAKPHRCSMNLFPVAESSLHTGAKLIAELRARRIEPWLAPTDADAVQTSRMLTERLVRDGTELLLIDSHLGDAAIGMSVAGKPVSRQVVLDRGNSFTIAGIDEIISLHERLTPGESSFSNRIVPVRSLFQGIDFAPAPAATRRDFGIASDAVVLLSHFEATGQPMSSEFIKLIIRLLARNPRAVFLLTGEVDETTVRAALDAAGAEKRVAFAPRLRSISPLVGMADLYVASFPSSSREGILTAMSVAKPVMILAGEHDHSNNAFLVGAPHAVVGNVSTLLSRCESMMRDAQLRQGVGTLLQRRASEKFNIRSTIDGLLQLAGDVMRQRRSMPARIDDFKGHSIRDKAPDNIGSKRAA